ncbi:MAG: YncE family protein, partial [Candidatus Sulfotelmatobacter sp.]
MRLYRGIVAAAVVSIAAISAAQDYHVADHWKLGGQGGWDYLLSDDSAHRLYVTHNARVEVVDTTTGKTIGAITGLKSTHGVALNPDGKTGYISDGAGNAIAVFDRSDFSVKATVAAGTNPDGIAFEPTTKTLW